VIGIDIIPTQPPRGVSAIQGNFLSDEVQRQVMDFVHDPERGRLKEQKFLSSNPAKDLTEADLDRTSTIVLADHGHEDIQQPADAYASPEDRTQNPADDRNGRVVNVVLSDMSAPWTQEVAYGKNSLNNPYFRLMNTSGNRFRDHAGSMVGGAIEADFRSC
jgi:21S rRNA (uridine2791-2'-O)-methyltransferase